MDVLPIIDLRSSGEADGAALTGIVGEIGAACRDVGFFYVVNHGVDQELIAKAFAQSHDFFALPTADKRSSRSRQLAATEAIPGSFTKRSTPRAGQT
jgi:isopenicillin N synthase-like dioxygenase